MSHYLEPDQTHFPLRGPCSASYVPFGSDSYKRDTDRNMNVVNSLTASYIPSFSSNHGPWPLAALVFAKILTLLLYHFRVLSPVAPVASTSVSLATSASCFPCSSCVPVWLGVTFGFSSIDSDLRTRRTTRLIPTAFDSVFYPRLSVVASWTLFISSHICSTNLPAGSLFRNSGLKNVLHVLGYSVLSNRPGLPAWLRFRAPYFLATSRCYRLTYRQLSECLS